MRGTLTEVARAGKSNVNRATGREYDSHNLMLEVKRADVHRGESPSKFEIWEGLGVTSVPLKQKQDQQPQQQTAQGSDVFNSNQPKGEASELLIMHVGGDIDHPVGVVADRRVKPYDMNEGETSHYAADGSEQMTFFNSSGAYLVSLDGKSVKNPDGNETRMASMRHVNKDMQSHKIDQNSQQQEYKHEGKTVNTEVRCTKDKIEIFGPGEKLVAVYTKADKKWTFDVDAAGKSKVEMDLEKIKITAPTLNEAIETAKLIEAGQEVVSKSPYISEQVTDRYETVSNTYLGLKDPRGGGEKVLTLGGPAIRTWAAIE